MEYYKQIKKAVSNNDLPKVATLWEEYCLGDELQLSEAIAILSEILKSTLAPSFGPYADQIMTLWSQSPSSDEKTTLLQKIFDLQTNNTLEVYEQGLAYIESIYSQSPKYDQISKLSGLYNSTSFQGIITNFLLLSHLKKGAFVFHTSGWGVGEVMDYSLLREEVSVEFETSLETKDLSIANALNTLIPLGEDHFYAQRFGDPDAFEELAIKDPVTVIKRLLSDLGPQTAGDIKHEMHEYVIPENKWAKWWQSARAKLKKDSLIESPASSKSPFCLRKQPLSLEERLQERLHNVEDPQSMIMTLYAFLRDFPTSIKNKGSTAHIASQCHNMLEKTSDQTISLQLHYILQDIGIEDVTQAQAIIKNTSSPASLLSALPVIAHKKRYLIDVFEVIDQWQQIYVYSIKEIDHSPLREYALTTLLENGFFDLVQSLAETLLATPGKFPTAAFWYFQKITSRSDLPLATPINKCRFLESFFILFYIIEKQKTHKDLLKKMSSFITENRFEVIRHIFKDASLASIEEILLLSTKCISLQSHDIQTLHSLGAVVYPELSTTEKYKEIEELEPIWTTIEGLQETQQRVQQIGTVETVENAKEIEVARSHGDLRENSEFKYALEKRDRLQNEIKRLSEEIKRMRILTKEDVDLVHVSPGVVVTLTPEIGKNIVYTILGPREADPENGILSYQSKLAKQLIGKKTGDHVTISDNTYMISQITLSDRVSS